jgi:hypothetical protein
VGTVTVYWRGVPGFKSRFTVAGLGLYMVVDCEDGLLDWRRCLKTMLDG